MPPRVSDGDVVIIQESSDLLNINGKKCACQTPDGITLKKLQLDEEKKRVLLRHLNQEYDVFVLKNMNWRPLGYSVRWHCCLGLFDFFFIVSGKPILDKKNANKSNT